MFANLIFLFAIIFDLVKFEVIRKTDKFRNRNKSLYSYKKIKETWSFQDKLDVTLHKNERKKKKRLPKEAEDRYNLFFSEMSKELISELYQYCKRDYEMFGYPFPKALTSKEK